MTQEISAERERLARLEGAYEHLATKADVERVRINIEQLRSELGRDIEQVRSELRALKWVIGIGIGAAGAIGPLSDLAPGDRSMRSNSRRRLPTAV